MQHSLAIGECGQPTRRVIPGGCVHFSEPAPEPFATDRGERRACMRPARQRHGEMLGSQLLRRTRQRHPDRPEHSGWRHVAAGHRHCHRRCRPHSHWVGLSRNLPTKSAAACPPIPLGGNSTELEALTSGIPGPAFRVVPLGGNPRAVGLTPSICTRRKHRRRSRRNVSLLAACLHRAATAGNLGPLTGGIRGCLLVSCRGCKSRRRGGNPRTDRLHSCPEQRQRPRTMTPAPS